MPDERGNGLHEADRTLPVDQKSEIAEEMRVAGATEGFDQHGASRPAIAGGACVEGAVHHGQFVAEAEERAARTCERGNRDDLAREDGSDEVHAACVGVAAVVPDLARTGQARRKRPSHMHASVIGVNDINPLV